MTKLFYKDKPLIGLDINETGMKIMAIDTKKWLVLGYGSIDLEPAKMKESFAGDGSYIADSLKKLVNEKIVGTLPSNHVVIGIPTAGTYSRTFTVPTSLAKNLKDAVQTEADQYIPIPSSTLYLDYQVIEHTKEELTVLMSAVAKPSVDVFTKAAEQANLRPVLIEPSISAVARLLTTTEEGHLPTVIVDIGPAGTDIAILDEGFIRVTASTAIGGNTFTLAIAKKMDITLENAHQLKVLNGLSAGPRQKAITSALQPNLQRIVEEVKKVMRYYNERISKDRKLEQLLIVGGGSNIPGLGEYFTNELVMPSRVASPWQQLNFDKLPQPARQFRSRYITVAGLASIKQEDIWR